MNLKTEPYLEQTQNIWPKKGRAILAQFNDDSIVVYQAYRPSIGHFAVENQFFGGDFSLGRMTWIKPNFLWMMYRSSWGQSEGQEVVLAVRLRRNAFDEILRNAVHSSFAPGPYANQEAWKQAVKDSHIRLQWDPDHGPTGGKLERRAIQLGLRGPVIAKYARDWILEIEDISDFVAKQRQHALGGDHAQLQTPSERIYPAPDTDTAIRLQLDHGRKDGAG